MVVMTGPESPLEDDDLDGLLEDAPDDLDDEDETAAWFASQLDVDDDELEEIAEDAAEAGGILAALALLKLFAAGWDALDDAESDAQDARLATPEAAVVGGEPGPSLADKLADIAGRMADDLAEQLDDLWGDDDGSGVASLTDVAAQSEYSESKSDADQDEGWEYAQYVKSMHACEVCSDCDGVILPIDDPWWDDHEPDNNHPNCDCLKKPLSATEAEALGGATKHLPDVDVSGWKDVWPPDVSGYPDALQAVYHSKLA
jgi:hypothetical protein